MRNARGVLALAWLVLAGVTAGCLPDASSTNADFASANLVMLTGTAADDTTDRTIRHLQVMVDGLSWATTPQGVLTTGYVAGGKHLVEAVAQGYEPFRQTYAFVPGVNSIVIHMTPLASPEP